MKRATDSAHQPNILWICTDQQRYDTIHALGNKQINTPNLDALCSQGVAFTHAYCQSPICTPSRASFLTGCYPSSIHVNRNGNAFFPEGTPLITKHLSDVGYDCGLVGKLHLASPWNGVEQRVDDGYRFFRYSTDPWQGTAQDNQYIDWLLKQGVDLEDIFVRADPEQAAFMRDKQGYRGYRPDVDPTLHQTTWCANEAVAFIASDHDTPWLLSVNIFDPHVPFDAPSVYQEGYLKKDLPGPLFRESDLDQQEQLADVYFQSTAQRPSETTKEMVASYYGMIELIDEQVGRMLAALEQSDQANDTVVIFMSDHGEMLGDHSLVRKGCRFYEGLVRVPLIIAWPGEFRQGGTCHDLVELTDIAPTLAAVAGKPLEDTHGHSLLPCLHDGTPLSRDFVRCEYLDALNPKWPDRSERHQQSFGTMYGDGRYKLVVYHKHGLGELYDLAEDPGEFKNLWDEPTLKGIKLDLMQRSFDASMVIADPGPPQIGPF